MMTKSTFPVMRKRNSPLQHDAIRHVEEDRQEQMAEDLPHLTQVPVSNLKLIEVCAEPDSRLTETALRKGMSAERWTRDDFDLSTQVGYLRASRRLLEDRPDKLWLSPPCSPFTQLQFIRPAKDLKHKTGVWKENLGKLYAIGDTTD